MSDDLTFLSQCLREEVATLQHALEAQSVEVVRLRERCAAAEVSLAVARDERDHARQQLVKVQEFVKALK